MTENIEVLKQADFCLSKCGRSVPPSGYASVDIPHGILYQIDTPAQANQQQPLTITGDTTFFLQAFSGMTAPSLVYVQFQFPNGRFEQQFLRQWNQCVGTGSNRYVLEQEIACEPGTEILITSDTTINNPGSVQPFSALFEGIYRYYLKPNPAFSRRLLPSQMAAALPRIFSSRNQNIMAPRWNGCEFPGDGDKFWYVSQQATLAVPSAGGGSNNTVTTATEVGYEFFLQRMGIVATFTGGSTGTPYIRVREGSGRELHDDYVNASRFSGQALPDFWRVPPGRDLIVDLTVMDSTGAGNVAIQYFFEGFRRRSRG